MTSHDAYPRMPEWAARALQRFEIGARGIVGPAYRSGGSCAADGDEGAYVVVGIIPDRAGWSGVGADGHGPVGADYKLARRAGGPWELIVAPSRLQPA